MKFDSQFGNNFCFIDHLSDSDLTRLNNLLPWQCFIVDSHGRHFGKASSPTKRNIPEIIPDRRISELNNQFPLSGLSVLEVGCFEGIHTSALAGYGANVIAIDSRIENVVKTITRTSCLGLSAKVLKCDVEVDSDFSRLPMVDITHHVGVLYHLVDPVSHLFKISSITRNAIMLDTHYSLDSDLNGSYNVNGINYGFKYFKESGRDSVFAGMYDHAKWLSLDTLICLLKSCGFIKVNISELRNERNGPRVLIYASRF